jgi:hypothetical protein
LEHALILIQPVSVDIDPMVLVERVASHGRTFSMLWLAAQGYWSAWAVVEAIK